jgi:hypothetical protein
MAVVWSLQQHMGMCGGLLLSQGRLRLSVAMCVQRVYDVFGAYLQRGPTLH